MTTATEIIDRIAENREALKLPYAEEALRCAERYGGMIDSQTLARYLKVSRWEAQGILSGLCDNGLMFYAGYVTGIYHVGREI